MPAVRADMHGHVLDHPQHRDIHLAEHLHPLFRVQQRKVLRRGHDHRTGHRHLLRQGQLDVAGARRHVDHQVVEVVPGGLGHQLQQRTGDHRATPYHRRVVVGEKRHRHDFHAMRTQRHEPLLVADLRPGPFGDTEHHALAGAIDVGIQDTHPRPFTGQGQGQVGGGGGLAHTALARGHGHDVLDVGQARNLRLGLVRGDHTGDLDLCRGHALDPLDGGLQHLGPAVLEQAGGIAQLQGHADPVALDIDAAHTPGADRVLVQVRVGVLAKDGFNRCASDGAHGDSR